MCDGARSSLLEPVEEVVITSTRSIPASSCSIEDDELVEVTPKSIRLRKTFLDPNERKRADRSKEALAG